MFNADSDTNQPPSYRTILITLLVIVCVYSVYFARDFLVPVVFAVFIALTFRPAVKHLARLGIPAWATAGLFMLLVIVAGFIAAYLIAGPVSAWIAEAPAYAKTFSRRLESIRSSFSQLINLTKNIEAATAPTTSSTATEVVVHDTGALTFFSYLAPVTGYSFGIAATFAVTLVFATFFMASGDLFYEKLVKVLPTLSDKKRALRIVFDIEREVSVYLLTVATINAALGLAVGTSFFMLGMPAPHLWGILVFVFNFIPYVGLVAGVSLSAFMAIVTFDSLGYALLVPLAYCFWNVIENQLVTPVFLGRRLELNAVAILLVLAFWTWLWGLAGTVLAVPILVILKICCEHFQSLAGLGEFLSSRHYDQPVRSAEENQNASS